MGRFRYSYNFITGKWMLVTLAVILCLPVIIGISLGIRSADLLHDNGLIDLLFSSAWAPSKGEFGFLPFILSSLYVTIIAFVLAAPVCLLAAMYITQFSKPRMMKIMYPVADVMAGIPSVIYGMWGIIVIIPFVRDVLAPLFNVHTTGYSILSGGIVLAVMCIPYMLNMLIESFKTVPQGLRESALALGATHWQMVKHVVVRKSFPGILSAFGLGITKAFGETLAVMMVVGNVVQFSLNPFDPAYPLPALIANNFGEMMSIPMYDSALMFAALILLVVILIINLFFRYFIYRSKKIR
ncbi:MAG: phosphate ABC transporter permease subunit PstC [Bacteroidales bacterium]|jgi:phosphate transport system permease protein|nr:phosphate ABC transporter permease subunit PstC [Bacteroidales bacterium]